MAKKPSYEELQRRVKELEKEARERKKDEEKLEQHLESLLHYSSLAIVTLDDKHMIISCNRYFENLFQFEEPEILGKNLDQTIARKEYIKDAMSYTKKTLRGEAIHGSGRRYRKDGTLIEVEFIGVPVVIEGKVTGAYGIYLDVTERKQAQMALRESEEKYKGIFNTVPTSIILIDKDGQMVDINPYHLTHIAKGKFPKKEFIGKNIVTHPTIVNTGLSETYKKVLEGEPFDKKDVYFPTLMARGDGYFNVKGVPFLKNHAVIGALIMHEDITERKQAEEALRESEERYKALFDRSLDCVYVHDFEGIFIDANPTALELLGYTKEEIPSVNFEPLLSEDQIPTALKVLEEITNTGFQKELTEFKLKRKDDTYVYVETKGSLIYRDGKPHAIQGIARDITMRRKAEEELRESEAQKKAILDASIDRIRLVDKDMRIIWANKTTTKELNVAPEDLAGQLCYKAFVGKDSPCTECPTKKALETGNIEHGILHQPKSKGIEGETYWDAYTVPIKNESGDIVNLIQVARNITDKVKAEEEKKKLQSQFQQAQRMEAIGTLAGGIAHNFNNVLMGIQGNASLILLGKTSDRPDYERLTNIEQGVLSGAELTKRLLGFARGGRYEVKPTDLNELIKTQNRMFGRTKKEITIRGKYQDNPWTVEVDQGQIEQVLLNLYVNAWQAMPRGGDLYIQTENITLDENYTKPFNVTPGRYVKISITDTGVGMDEATQHRIFEPFFTTQEMGIGTGLGLASAYGIIKNHGGIINVYSAKGEGSTFTVYLPASEKEVIKEEKVPEKLLKGTETILLVDDEDVIIDVGEGILKTLGYKVLIARGGKEAIEIISKAHRAKRKEDKRKKRHAPGAMPPAPDIVILDMIMPGMGGGETYDRLKEIDPDIKVLLSSGYSINGQATEILKRGCDGFIQKPFTLKGLSKAIREVLDKD